MCSSPPLLHSLQTIGFLADFVFQALQLNRLIVIMDTYLRLLITAPRVSKLQSPCLPFLNLVVVDGDWDARSLPTISTKLCITFRLLELGSNESCLTTAVIATYCIPEKLREC